ncbi:MAG: signal peptide peptidase SppA [Muribaculaceae bacterium]|nr:signal peptide peptidase SppA [Muribaculaceae bacterium]
MLKRFFISMLGTMAGLWVSLIVLFIGGMMLLGVFIAKAGGDSAVAVEKKSILYFDLSGTIADRNQPTSFIQMLQNADNDAPTIEDMILSLRAAADDDRIEGLYLNCAGASMGMASRQELIDAIYEFKESGKWVYAYGDMYSQGDYMIASTATTIALNPMGSVDIHGVGGTTPFFKELLDKLGIKMQIIKVGTYKSAVEPYILNAMSEPARQQMQQYIDSIWAYASEEIAYGRAIPVDTIRRMASELIFTRPADTFVAAGLADTLLYRRQAENVLREYCDIDLDEDLRFISPADYVDAENLAEDKLSRKHVAVLYAIGDIVDSGKSGIVGPKMVDEIVELADNDKVAGMVLRVNSPGGSAFASEQIWEALQYFKSKNKPLYVSMGDYAASGGYYISCGADSIFADRTTLTGSIGVFGMIPDVSGLVTDKLGVHFSTVETNPNAAGITDVHAMIPAQYQAMQQHVETIYDLFTKRVAAGRNMPQDSVKAIAEGRVWIGGDAVKLGLVDGLASLDEVIEAMCYDLDLDSDCIARYPLGEDKLWEKFLRDYGNLDDLKLAGYDAETLRMIETVQRLRSGNPMQARMEYIIFQ